MTLTRTEKLSGFFRSAGENDVSHLGDECSQATGFGERFDTDISRELEGFVAKSFQHSMDHLRPRLHGVGRCLIHWQGRDDTLNRTRVV